MSNTRFVNKGLNKPLPIADLQALIGFYEKGGTITVIPTPKRPKKGYTNGRARAVKG